MTGPPLEEFDARPRQSLPNHLEGVVAGADTLVPPDSETPYGNSWPAMMEIIAWTHDIGKLTPYFQEYLRTGSRAVADDPKLTYHGEVSALVTSQALYECGFGPQAVAAGFFAVAKHHSVHENLQAEVKRYSQKSTKVRQRFERAERQLKKIDCKASTAADTVLKNATGGTLAWDDVWWDAMGNYVELLCKVEPHIDDDEFYGCVLRAWSTLVAADKSDASGLTALDNVVEFTDTKRPSLDSFVQTLTKVSDTRLPDGERSSVYLDEPFRKLPGRSATTVQRLDALRAAANGRAVSAIDSHQLADTNVFELTLPTGFGKTYVGLRAALVRAEERDSRVVYALPYTSIIEQVDDVVNEAFGIEAGSGEYTKHHHLADTRTAPNELRGERYSTGQDVLHAESWRAGLVLTTFTQLFESIAGPKNVQSMKLPALRDSVIIIDEPQAISLEWWALVGRLIEYVTEEYNATVVLMTATQPKILEQLPDSPDPTPLFDLEDECVGLLKDHPRVSFELHRSLEDFLDDYHASPLGLKAAATELSSATQNGTNSLAVVNTVESAATLIDHLNADGTASVGQHLLHYREDRSEEFDEREYLESFSQEIGRPDRLLVALTTRLRPVDRSALLDVLALILDPEKSTPFDDVATITVSTQLIEAGVDLSFDRLYRDFAPLPAIVQAAGRCNRTFGDDTSRVTIWRLASPEDREYIPSQLIYGDGSLLRPTRTVLEELRTEADEHRLPEATVVSAGVKQYYSLLHDQLRTGESADQLAEAFDDAKSKFLRESSLISQEYPTQDILILATEDELDTYRQYQQDRDAERWRKSRQSFQALKRYLVSIPVETEPESVEPLAIGPDRIGDYEVTTGRGVDLDTIVFDTEL